MVYDIAVPTLSSGFFHVGSHAFLRKAFRALDANHKASILMDVWENIQKKMWKIATMDGFLVIWNMNLIFPEILGMSSHHPN